MPEPTSCPSCGVRLTRGEVQQGRCGSCGAALDAARAAAGTVASRTLPVRDDPAVMEQVSWPQERDRPGAKPGRSAVLPFFVFLLAFASLVFALCYDPFQVGFGYQIPFVSPLMKYNLANPRDAYLARDRIRLNRDLLADAAYRQKSNFHKLLKEQIKTLTINREADFKTRDAEGKEITYKILFTHFQREGKEMRTAIFMKKHDDSGIWQRSFVGNQVLQKENPALAKEVAEWNTTIR